MVKVDNMVKKVILCAVKYLTVLVLTAASVLLIAYILVKPYANIAKIGVDAIFGNKTDYTLITENALMDKKNEIVSAIEAERQYWADKGYTSKVSVNEMDFPEYSEKYGVIRCERLGINADLYMGDNDKILKVGAGTYYGGNVPGDQGTIMIAAHCHTFFRTLEKAQIGDIFNIETTYGDYVYKVNDIKIIPATDTESYDFTLDYENLIVYTCFPLNTLLSRTQRFMVYCELVDGTLIDRGAVAK